MGPQATVAAPASRRGVCVATRERERGRLLNPPPGRTPWERGDGATVSIDCFTRELASCKTLGEAASH